MTFQELDKIRVPAPRNFIIEAKEHKEWDKYGQYSTGCFKYKGKIILITIDDNKWHMSVSANPPLGYYELKQIRYEFLPNFIHAAQIFPPREEFVNIHENCYHFYEI